jgi:hypothetical protein
MGYKIRKYNNFKRRFIFETYEPKPRLKLTKENTFPALMNVGNNLSSGGGWFSLFFSGLLLSIKSFFGIRKKIERNGKVVEFRIKK